ncbi:MAG: hypothetical protein JHD35_08265 [Sphingopyxis sp.]|nr:hypothetical protein [Sphingopyxis sp.]
MGKYVRPFSRVAAVELKDCEIDTVNGGGGFGNDAPANTDVYTNIPNSEAWKYDGSHPD